MPTNDDPFQPWNNPMHRDNPFAAHNDPMYADDPFKPWNDPFGKSEDLTDEEAKTYGINRRRYDDDEEDE